MTADQSRYRVIITERTPAYAVEETATGQIVEAWALLGQTRNHQTHYHDPREAQQAADLLNAR